MSTTSTYPTTLDTLLTAINAAMSGALAGVKAYEGWPGPDAVREMILFTGMEWDEYAIPTIKTGRVLRDEVWRAEFELIVASVETSTPPDPSDARDRAFAILAALENLLANDTTAGATGVLWLEVHPQKAEPRVFEKGWGYGISGVVVCNARLS